MRVIVHHYVPSPPESIQCLRKWICVSEQAVRELPHSQYLHQPSFLKAFIPLAAAANDSLEGQVKAQDENDIKLALDWFAFWGEISQIDYGNALPLEPFLLVSSFCTTVSTRLTSRAGTKVSLKLP